MVKYARQRRKYWNVHAERMEENRLAKKAKVEKSMERKSQGRPKKKKKHIFSKMFQ